MAVDYDLTFEWVVSESLPWWKFLVLVNPSLSSSDSDSQQESQQLKPEDCIVVRAVCSWKMKQWKIKLLPWDKVKVILNETDVTQWRIVYRLK